MNKTKKKLRILRASEGTIYLCTTTHLFTCLPVDHRCDPTPSVLGRPLVVAARIPACLLLTVSLNEKKKKQTNKQNEQTSPVRS